MKQVDLVIKGIKYSAPKIPAINKEDKTKQQASKQAIVSRQAGGWVVGRAGRQASKQVSKQASNSEQAGRWVSG